MNGVSDHGRRIPLLLLLGAALLFVSQAGIAACRRAERSPADGDTASNPDYTPTATIKDLMQGMIDPAADAVWLSVTSVQTVDGSVDTVPKTDEDWNKVRHGALALAEAANLLAIPGRHVARPGERSETPGVELEPEEMDALIANDLSAWVGRTHELREAGVAALAAADARDPDKVFEVGERIEHACENCHSHYWYPNEKIPPILPDPPSP